MIGLGHDMSAISDALWRDDLAAVATAARAIADHPHASTSERERIQAGLGDDFSDFVKGDQRVHQSAVRLAEQAAAGDTRATSKSSPNSNPAASLATIPSEMP